MQPPFYRLLFQCFRQRCRRLLQTALCFQLPSCFAHQSICQTVSLWHNPHCKGTFPLLLNTLQSDAQHYQLSAFLHPLFPNLSGSIHQVIAVTLPASRHQPAAESLRQVQIVFHAVRVWNCRYPALQLYL